MRRLLAVLPIVAVLGTATAASAHVTVNPRTAEQGGFAKLSFRVPNEKGIPTTKLEVAFPSSQPLAFVSVKPHPGWTYKVTKTQLKEPMTVEGEKVTEAVSRIAWTTQGVGVKPGEFEEFDVSVGPLPKAESMTFKALQTYSDGSVVRWIETGEGADLPAPVLTLTAPASAHSGDSHTVPTTASATPAATSAPATASATAASVSATAQTADEDDSDALTYGVGAVALLALVLSLVGVSRRKS